MWSIPVQATVHNRPLSTKKDRPKTSKTFGDPHVELEGLLCACCMRHLLVAAQVPKTSLQHQQCHGTAGLSPVSPANLNSLRLQHLPLLPRWGHRQHALHAELLTAPAQHTDFHS